MKNKTTFLQAILALFYAYFYCILLYLTIGGLVKHSLSSSVNNPAIDILLLFHCIFIVFPLFFYCYLEGIFATEIRLKIIRLKWKLKLPRCPLGSGKKYYFSLFHRIDKSYHIYRWRSTGQSRPGRLWGCNDVGRQAQRNFGRVPAHYQ